MRLPDGVIGMAGRGPDWARWVDRLPRLATDLMAAWGLRRDGWAMHGYCSLVLPALTVARDWTIVRMVVDASWTVADAGRADRRLTTAEQERITCCVAIAKAVQD